MSKLHIYRRPGESSHWQAQAYVGGKRYRFSCETDDKATAREYARQRVDELRGRHNRGLIGFAEPVRMSQVFDRYEREYGPRLRESSRQRMGHVLKLARSWFVEGSLHDPYVHSVTAGDVQAFLTVKQSDGACGRTVNLYRSNLYRVFQLCVRPWLLIPANPVAGTEPLPHDPRVPVLPSRAEYEVLRGACTARPMLHLFMTLAWETGARSGELLALEWSDVDFTSRMLTFPNDPVRGRQTKGHRTRVVPLSDAAVSALRDHAARFRLLAPLSSYVFKHLRRDKSALPGYLIESLYLPFKRVAKAAGFPALRPHDLRHCFVTRKLAAGVPAQLVMRYVGHADLATTLRYTHLVPEHLRAVVTSAASTVPSSA